MPGAGGGGGGACRMLGGGTLGICQGGGTPGTPGTPGRVMVLLEGGGGLVRLGMGLGPDPGATPGGAG